MLRRRLIWSWPTWLPAGLKTPSNSGGSCWHRLWTHCRIRSGWGCCWTRSAPARSSLPSTPQPLWRASNPTPSERCAQPRRTDSGRTTKAALSDGQRIARSYQNMVDPIATVDTPERQLIETLGRALLLSGTYGLTETQRDAYLAVVAQTVRDTVAAIQPPSRQRITLTSRSESIPMLIRNNLDHDVIVRLDFNSDKLDFPEGDSLLRRLSPRGEPDPGAGAGQDLGRRRSGDQPQIPHRAISSGRIPVDGAGNLSVGHRGRDRGRRSGHPDGVVGSKLVVPPSFQIGACHKRRRLTPH